MSERQTNFLENQIDRQCEQRDVAVFGGSFDPVHNAHLEIIEYLSQNFDKVLVVPSNVSPFKQERTSNEHRLAMLQLALKTLPKQAFEKIIVDVQEFDRRPPSYTIDTLKNIKQAYQNDTLHLCLGQDAASKFDKWKDIEQIQELCKIVVLKRSTFGLNMFDDNFASLSNVEQKQKLIELNKKLEDINSYFEVDYLGFPKEYSVVDKVFDGCSSTVARVACSIGWGACFLPNCVLDYVNQYCLYNEYTNLANCLYDSKWAIYPSRIAHIKRATLNGVQLAQQNGVDIDKTVKAMLLHDIAKCLGLTELEKLGIDTTHLQSLGKNILHSHAGKQVVQKYFDISDNDILDAIKYHTTGNADMTGLQKTVFLADCVEQDRLNKLDFEELKSIIVLAYSGDLDKAMLQALTASVNSLNNRKVDIDANTLSALAYYEKVIGV